MMDSNEKFLCSLWWWSLAEREGGYCILFTLTIAVFKPKYRREQKVYSVAGESLR